MQIKLANNAIGRLGASIGSADTSVVLVESDAHLFPILGAGQWHPMTIAASSGAFEIVKVVARDENILTVERGFDNTIAMDFISGSRAEIRMTAAVIDNLQQQIANSLDAAVVLMDDKDADMAANLSTALTALMDGKDAEQLVIMDSKDNALHTVITGEVSAAKSEAIASANTHSDAALASAVATLSASIAAQAEPVGTMKMWLGATAESGLAFCYGQALSRSTYASLYAFLGTTYGAGDGSTTFNLPDFRGRTGVGRDNMGGTAAGRVTAAGSGLDGATLGAVGGAQTHTLTAAQIPAHTHPVNDPGHSHTQDCAVRLPSSGNNFNTPFAGGGTNALTTNSSTTGVTVGNNTGGGGGHNNMQPTIIVNYVIKLA
jgi:microcystin-dependent protein